MLDEPVLRWGPAPVQLISTEHQTMMILGALQNGTSLHTCRSDVCVVALLAGDVKVRHDPRQ